MDHIYIGILFIVIAYPHEKPCGGNLNGLFGQINSPNYPEKYPDNLKCIWKISVPGMLLFVVTFMLLITVENIFWKTYTYMECRTFSKEDFSKEWTAANFRKTVI